MIKVYYYPLHIKPLPCRPISGRRALCATERHSLDKVEQYQKNKVTLLCNLLIVSNNRSRYNM